jgi:uncharacterized protein YkwD
MVHRWLVLVLTLAWLLPPTAAPGQAVEEEETESHDSSAAKPVQRDPEPDPAAVAERIVSRTNAFRHKEGRRPVEVEPKLMATARDFAHFMARTDKYGHTADGRGTMARTKQHGYEPCLIAENIAYQHSPAEVSTEALARRFSEGWQHSPGHRKNMLNPAATETGVGVARSEQTGYYYAVQLVGRPISQQIEFAITNTSDAVIQYAIGGRTLPLPPRSTRTHQRCQPAEVTFKWPNQQQRTTVQAQNRDRYTIVQGGSGTFRVRKG